MWPHELIHIRFFNERNLVNDSAFKREENLVNDVRVPAFGGIIHNLTDFSYALPIVRG
jgi:hypothetical protein